MVEQVPAHAWQRWVSENGSQIVDVREPHEIAAGTLPDAQRISLGSLSYEADRLDRDRPLLVICRSGARSNVAAISLARSGFRKVANLDGGLAALGMA